MNAKKVIAGTFIGTSGMTLFSYIVSEIEQNNFKEPELLAMLGHRLATGTDKNLLRVAGWQLHYAVALAFVSSYDLLWRKTKLKPTPGAGLVLGGISGIIGALVWKIVFNILPNPPRIKFKKYYLQLVAAHLIFGLFSTFGYRLFCNTKTFKRKEANVIA
jgi:hypothetical protein